MRTTSEFGAPIRLPAKRKTKEEIFEPTRGLHAGFAPQHLPAGFTPESQNFVASNGFLTPRSALSQFGAFTFSGPVLGTAEVFDLDGSIAGFAASATSFAMIHPDTARWSALSYIKGSTLGADNAPSGLSTDYWDSTSIYDADADSIIAVSSNYTNWLKWFKVDGSTTTFSDFTWVNSLDSIKAAQAVAAINDRLVLFNVLSSEGTAFPQRVAWSARGKVRDFVPTNGAAFEDLLSMRGKGKAALRFQDFLILLTDQEVWRAQPTLDDYAFRFERVEAETGCPYPRTAVSTPVGVFFLGRDYEVYITDGIRVIPAGPIGGRGPSRIQKLISSKIKNPLKSWGVFNRVERRYELYFADTDSSSGFANHALFYDIDQDNWFHQKFSHELSLGMDLEDPGTQVRWDEMTMTWEQASAGWNSYGAAQNARWITTFSSDGTIFRFRSDSTNDDGIAIDARWQSHGMRQVDAMRQTHLKELWIDYEADSDSSMSVYVGSSVSGRNFDSGTAASLTTENTPVFIPTWITDNAPLFEVRIKDGSKPRIARFQAWLTDAGRFGGAL